MSSTRQGEGVRERKKRDKRERIRRAAWELFTTAGYEATTTVEVARRAGVATGTLFLYAKDKPDLLFLVFEQRLARALASAFRTLPIEAPLIEQLLFVFGRLFTLYERHDGVGRHFVKELPGAAGPNARRAAVLTLEFLRRLEGLVAAAQQRGEVSPETPAALVAQSAFALYFLALFSWLSGGLALREGLESFLRPSLALLLRGAAREP